MAKSNMKILLIALVAVIAYVLIAGNPFADKVSEPTPIGSTEGCAVEDVSFTPKMVRLGKAGTSLSTVDNTYFILTDGLGETAANTATTVPTNYDIEVMFGENSTAYYTVVDKLNTDCQDPLYHSVKLAFADQSLNSLYAKNADGSVNAAANDQAMGADDTFEPTVTMKAGTDTYFGNPDSSCENVGVVEFDKTYIRQVTGDNPTTVPGFFTYSNTSAYDGNAAFIIPKSADGSEVSFNLVIESTSTEPTGSNDPILYVYDCDIDKNEDDLSLIHGVEDEDLNQLSIANQTLQIHLS